ncbi:MAG: serine hydrolase [Candidatus Saliniplasma sp.]
MGKNIDSLDENKSKVIEDFVSWWMTEGKVPGMSLSIVKGDEIKYAKGFGSRDLENDLPATVETIYGIGSISKSFTALAIMKLFDRGDLDVEDPVSKYLPVNWSDSIKIHHLLTHSSGMPSLGVSEVLIARLIGLEERGVPLGDLDDLYMHVNNAKNELSAEPGKRFFYFNTGYCLLGQVIEKVSGESYRNFIKDEVLEPLSMHRSTFEPNGRKDVMTPYFSRNGEPTETALPVREFSFPAGGLLCPVDELSNYLIMNMNGGSFEGESLVDEELMKIIHKGHISRENSKYGYGWSVKDFQGKKMIGHGGSIAVASAYVGFTEDTGVALACNTSPSYSVETVATAVMNILNGNDWKDMPFFARKNRLDMLQGHYETFRGARKAKIEQHDGLLRLEFQDKLEKQSIILIPKKKDICDFEFYYLDGEGERNTVEFDVGGKEDIDLYVGRYLLHKK